MVRSQVSLGGSQMVELMSYAVSQSTASISCDSGKYSVATIVNKVLATNDSFSKRCGLLLIQDTVEGVALRYKPVHLAFIIKKCVQ